MMEIPAVTTRADVLATAARRLRQHYGDALIALYAMPDDPYEPTGENFALDLVIVLTPPFDFFAENESISRLLDDVNRAYDGAFLVYGNLTGPDDELGVSAQEGGVRL